MSAIETPTPFNLERAIADETAKQLDRLGVWDSAALTIPSFLLKQTSGACVECGQDTENTDDGDWICEGCLEDARAETRSENRHNDPCHGQAKYLNSQR